MTTATNWFVNFWFALYIPTALKTISWKLYIIFAVICFTAAAFTWAFQVETANRSLEEMDTMFAPGRTHWPFLDKDLRRVNPRRNAEALGRLSSTVQDIKQSDTGHVEKV